MLNEYVSVLKLICVKVAWMFQIYEIEMLC